MIFKKKLYKFLSNILDESSQRVKKEILSLQKDNFSKKKKRQLHLLQKGVFVSRGEWGKVTWLRENVYCNTS